MRLESAVHRAGAHDGRQTRRSAWATNARGEAPSSLDRCRSLVVDNYDSFVFNLVQYLGQLGVHAQVWRNDDDRLADRTPRRRGPSTASCSPRPRHPGARRRLDPARQRVRRRGVPLCSGCASATRPSGWPSVRKVDRAPKLRHGRPAWSITRIDRCAARTSGSVHRHPLPLADDPARHPTRRAARSSRTPEGSGVIMALRAAHRVTHPRGAIPPRIHPHRGRSSDAGQLAGLLRRPPWPKVWFVKLLRRKSPTRGAGRYDGRLGRKTQRDRGPLADATGRCPAAGLESPPHWSRMAAVLHVGAT